MPTNPKFKIIDREGMASVWIGEWNVHDFKPKSLTPDILDAIKRAYSLGVIHTKCAFQDFTRAIPDSFFVCEFEDQRKP